MSTSTSFRVSTWLLYKGYVLARIWSSYLKRPHFVGPTRTFSPFNPNHGEMSAYGCTGSNTHKDVLVTSLTSLPLFFPSEASGQTRDVGEKPATLILSATRSPFSSTLCATIFSSPPRRLLLVSNTTGNDWLILNRCYAEARGAMPSRYLMYGLPRSRIAEHGVLQGMYSSFYFL